MPKLIAFLLINGISFALIIIGHNKFFAVVGEIANGQLSLLAKVVVIPTAGTMALGLISWLVPKHWKETLVF